MKYTLFLTALLSVASLADASSHNRILKKRTPAHLRRQLFPTVDDSNNNNGNNNNNNRIADDGGANNNKGVINAGNGPSVAPQDSTSSPAVPTTSSTSSDTKETQTTTTSDDGGLLGPILGPITSTSSSSSPSSSSTIPTSSIQTSSSALRSSSVAPSSSIPVPSSSILVPTSTPSVVAISSPTIETSSQSTITATITDANAAAAAAETSAPAKPSGGVTTIQRNTIIVLVAIGGSIGVIALIWTIIRKWKFSPSSDFEDRMQPIDWQPTPDDGIIHRARPTSHGSFSSADSHNADNYNRNLRGQDLAGDLPPHDLLSGANHTGYADLYRGPSPQPQMSEGLQRGPSLTRAYY